MNIAEWKCFRLTAADYHRGMHVLLIEDDLRAAEYLVQALDLCALAHDLVEFYGAVAEEAGLALAIEDCSCVNIEGSRDLIAQAIGNLLENAIKYTPAGGAVTVQVIQADNAVELRVNDNGPGIAEAERARVLERFVRLESARRREMASA